MNKTAIVIGATGLVGSQLVKQLVEHVHISQVITLTRRPVPCKNKKVTNHVVDFDHLAQHAPLFKGDVLFSCLGTTKKTAGSITAQRKVDFDYQFQAAELAVNMGVTHYLLVSSSGANAHSSNAYLKMKGELENAVKKLPFKRISIIQPSLLLGQRDGDFRIGEKIGSVLLPVLSMLPGLKKFKPISGEQVAVKMCNVCTQEGVGVEYFTLNELFES
ncbi:short chain dehydrogenase [Pseudoalteromonas sp. S1727]|uniref:NAD(P)H-binding protein n=1 Tax=Pseudoalteromonas sp. S1727 TaxID=2066514 RepID=UPI0011084727|nr:NAD(P)H-binding protein [Pseudoalteromonas sp. S1727]TMN70635.1 short chain dehydrogenase [Pseudoalteromonas sp. S1727]